MQIFTCLDEEAYWHCNFVHLKICSFDEAGKSTEHLNNLRPISLTNSDVKLITNSSANRMSKIMPEVIHVTERNCNFVVEDCLALNCNLSSLLVFPNKRNAQWELKIVCISVLNCSSIRWHKFRRYTCRVQNEFRTRSER